MDPYRILQVRSDAEDAVIAAAYRALARRYHPDVVGDRAARSMTEINAAWEILRDPARRREYDRSAGAAPVPARASAAAARPGYSAAPSFTPAHDDAGRHAAGVGAAGSPPGRPSGSVLTFGRHLGWSIGEIARVDPGYLEWLEGKPEGKRYLEEIDAILRRVGYRAAPEERTMRRRWFGRS